MWAKLVNYSKTHRLSKPLYHSIKNLIHAHTIHQELAADIQHPEIVLVYQMAKVGSSSITRTIKANGIHPAYQIHTLNRRYIENIWQNIKLHESYFGRDVIDRDVIVSRYLSRRIKRLIGNQKIKVISVVRDPVARNISHFFQGIEAHFPNLTQRFEASNLDLEEVVQMFWEHQGWRVDYHWKWFEREFKEILGIDIFSIDFSPEEGYKINKFKDINIELLMLKLEVFNQSLGTALKDFFGLPSVHLRQDNISNKKAYHPVYKQFLEEIQFSEAYLDKIYGHQFMRHFYTQAEIENFKYRWLG